MKEQKWTHEGFIEFLPNRMFRVRLDNEDLILSVILILPYGRVKIEISRSDLTKGRIIYRLCNKDSKDSILFSISTFREDTI
uniref:Translational initiation factor 1 n=1 Tax=Tolypanthus maclurei TaxID=1026954 RepID=A0A4D5YFT5_9MAGN|nr:translational initiation factor 1 [Tolypanthus maclurei]QBS54584.1 translational initiation factor 1 [Tolypanthus maclurei]